MNDSSKCDPERIEELEQKVKELLESHKDFNDKEIRRVLIEVAQNYVWKQGLIERIKFAANVIGMLGIIGGAVIAILTILGVEVSLK